MINRKVLKFDQFNVYVFTFDKGDTKHFRATEVNRGLTDHGPTTLFTVSAYTKGKFLMHRPGYDNKIYNVGDGTPNFALTEDIDGLVIEGLEDGSEYHCICANGEAKFWNRSVKVIEPGLGLIDGGENKYMYIAAGKMTNNDKEYQAPALLKLEKDTAFDVKETSIVATLWI